MSILWFGLVLFGILSAAFTVYALVMIGRCSCLLGELPGPGPTVPDGLKIPVSLNFSPYLSSTFKYKNGVESAETVPEKNCVVCLCEFEDEEFVRRLSVCRHCFHAPCIDMWLYSHNNCPICRQPIYQMDSDASTSDVGMGSMDGLLDVRISS